MPAPTTIRLLATGRPPKPFRGCRHSPPGAIADGLPDLGVHLWCGTGHEIPFGTNRNGPRRTNEGGLMAS